MQQVRKRDTPCEMALRLTLHSRGLRYRIDVSPLSGERFRADLVFRRERVAVFVDGCFWHFCPDHGEVPRSNHEWWTRKFQRNRERDELANTRLLAEGWLPVRFWEHEDMALAADVVQDVVLSQRRPRSRSRRGKRS